MALVEQHIRHRAHTSTGNADNVVVHE
jgi:hypothetical protein